MKLHTSNWARDAIFYQIFPDRFAKSNNCWQNFSLESAIFETWDSPPSIWGYKGGDLWGIVEHLDYFQELGIDAIYFTPIFQSASNHRYHTYDYYLVDPLLGGNVAFKELLSSAHQRNINILLDGVFNHASRGFFYFHDVFENGEHSPWLHWLKIQGLPLNPYSPQPNYRCWNNNSALPEFNLENPAVREYLMQVAEYWIQFGIDGWRLDVPFEIKVPGFWQEFRNRVKAINPEAYIVGEIWWEAQEWLDGTQFDGVMNYPFAACTMAFTAGDRVQMEYVNKAYQPYPSLDAPGYAAKIQHLLQLYPWEIQLTQLNLLNSHDTARLITIAGTDKASMELATLLLLTYPGAPSIYYGDEVGLEGGLDPDCRRAFPQEGKWDLDVLAYHRQLIAIRRTYSSLRNGNYVILYAQANTYVFARTQDREEVIVAVNVGSKTSRVTLELTGLSLPSGSSYTLRSKPSRLLYGRGEVHLSSEGVEFNKLALSLYPRAGLILGPSESE